MGGVKKQIIAIGGGGFTEDPQKQFKMEKYLLQQTNKEKPKICFLAQASAEANEYVVKFYETFCALAATPTHISLFGRVENTWQERLLQQDIIYVGGGNTRSMLALWREWKMDEVLLQAYKAGIVLAGISAGAICWFEECVTDSVWPLGVLKGLNFLKGSCCPHYDSEPERRPTYLSKVKALEILPGIALQDHTAAHFIDNQLSNIIATEENKTGFSVTPETEKALDTRYI